jgi:anti-anti-sigma regulatory factor
MLRITVVEGGADQKLMVEGKLTGPYIPELESAWNEVRHAGWSHQIVIDLSDVTSIDSSGEAALTAMVADGARLLANGVFTKHLIRRLVREAKRQRRWHPARIAGC